MAYTTREFDILKVTLPSLMQLTAAGVAAAWLAPHPVAMGAATILTAILLTTVRRLYVLIQEEA